MNNDVSRRRVLQLGALGGIGLLALGQGSALAAEARAAAAVHLLDLGPGVETFTMMSSALDGDTVYIATRNVNPMKVVAFHLPSATITSTTDVFGESTQAIAIDPTGRYLYGCLRYQGNQSRMFRIDLTAPGRPMESLADVPDLEPFAMAISPDGQVFVAGREPEPRVRQYDPATDTVTTLATPDPTAQYGRSLYATESTVYFALRGTDPETAAAAARLYSIDRATGEATSILPPELATRREVRDITRVGDDLVFVDGSVGAIMSIDDPGECTILRSPMSIGSFPVELNGRLYFVGLAGVVEYDPATGEFRGITQGVIDLASVWGLFAHGGSLVAVSAYGLVVEVDPTSSDVTAHDLNTLGAPVDAQLAMSIAAGGGSVYVGGTNAIGRHDLTADTVSIVRGPDEAKDMVLVGGILYTAQYSGRGIMAFDPQGEAQELHTLVDLPDSQNRPHDALWDPERARLYIGSGSDAKVHGALTVFDPATSEIESFHADPFGDKQQVRCMTRSGSTLYLGGEADGRSQVLAWDLDAQAESWRVSFDSAADSVCGLAVDGDHLIVLGYQGKLDVVDLESRQVVHSATHPELVPDYGWGSLSEIGGSVYGITSTAFFRIAAPTFEPEVLVDDLAADWYGVPRVAVDETGQVYGIQGRNLVQITGLESPQVETTVQSRCIAGKVVLQVRVRNDEQVPVDVEIDTPFGGRSFTEVAPGSNAFHAFSTRARDIPAGSVQVHVSRATGAALAGTTTVEYGPSSCR